MNSAIQENALNEHSTTLHIYSILFVFLQSVAIHPHFSKSANHMFAIGTDKVISCMTVQCT